MSVPVESGSESPDQKPAPVQGVRLFMRAAENHLLSVVLAAMMVLPLAEVVLRKLFHVGITNSTALVQHLTLLISMLGGAIAARDRRLLSMSALPSVLKGRWKSAAAMISGSFAAVIAALLCVASVQFVLSEKPTGLTLAYGIPFWVIQCVLPFGYGLVGWRLLRHSSATWWSRGLALLAGGALIWLVNHPPVEPDKLVILSLVALLCATVLGAPIFVTLGGTAMILFWGESLPIASLPLDHYRLVTNPSLPTIPLFTLSGYLLAEGGASKRLIDVFQALVGQFRGGPAVVTAVVCAFFTSFTGASGVTILALGGLLMPVLLAARYSERSALGLLTGSGALGLLFPPSLPLILYAIIAGSHAKSAGVTIERMFLGGLGPGVLLVAMTAWWGIRQGPKEAAAARSFDAAEAGRAIWRAKWELLVPVVALVSLFGGFATPVEAAALTALYVFLIEVVVHRDLHLFRDVPRVMTECGLLVGGVLLILGVALGFTNFLVDAEVPAKAVEWVTQTIHSRYAFLLVLNVLLLIVGCLMDTYSAIVVVVPLLVPLGAAYGIDPIHLGIIFLANMELGLLMPTVGINLFLSSYRFGKPVMEVTRAVLPMQGVLLLGVLLITYIPPLTTFLPKWFK